MLTTKMPMTILCGAALAMGACGLGERTQYRDDVVPVTDGSTAGTGGGAATAATGAAGTEGSATTSGVDECLPPAGDGCPHTQGYWKNHNQYGFHAKTLAWPIAETTELCGQTWFDILWTPPKGDAWLILAHQYIAASLNVASGATTSPEVDAALVEAEAYLSACSIVASDRADALAISELLDAFNNGNEDLGGCGEPPDDSSDDCPGETDGGDTGGDDSGGDTGGDDSGGDTGGDDSGGDTGGGDTGGDDSGGDTGGNDDGGEEGDGGNPVP